MTTFFDDDTKNYEAVYWRIMNEIRCDDTDKESLYQKSLSAFKSGSPSKMDNAVITILGGKNWDWPWFDSWYEKFSVSKMWPRMWADFEIYQEDKEKYFKKFTKQKCVLLSHTLFMMTYTFRRIALIQRDWADREVIEKMPGYKYYIYLNMIDDGYFSVEKDAVGGQKVLDEEHFPPYFPGDRTSLSGYFLKEKDLHRLDGKIILQYGFKATP